MILVNFADECYERVQILRCGYHDDGCVVNPCVVRHSELLHTVLPLVVECTIQYCKNMVL